MPERKKILLLSVRAGGGHIAAAEAVAAALTESTNRPEVLHLEALDLCRWFYRKSFEWTHVGFVKYFPALWRSFYECLEHKNPGDTSLWATNLLDRHGSGPLQRAIVKFQPDAIVCTHFLPAHVVGLLKASGKIKAWHGVVLTDYAIHPIWLQREVDTFFVATDEMKCMGQQLLPQAKLVCSGIPIRCPQIDGVTTTRQRKIELRRKLELLEDRPTLLLLAGSTGWAPLDHILCQIATKFEQLQIVTVAGKNKGLYERLLDTRRNIPHAERIRICSFVDNMPEWMLASDMAVSRSGGLTASECLTYGLPMLIVNPIPGQEERNTDYLLESGSAWRAHSIRQLLLKIEALLSDHKKLERMRLNALAAAKPQAARIVAEHIEHAITPTDREDDRYARPMAVGRAVRTFTEDAYVPQLFRELAISAVPHAFQSGSDPALNLLLE